MTHIGIDIRVLTTGRLSGVEEYTRHLVSHLVALDRTIRFSLVSIGRMAPREQEWMRLPNVQVYHKKWSSRMTMASMRFASVPRLDVIAGRPSVFFFPHFIYGALSHRCRRVMTFHDLSFERFPEFFSLRRRLWHSMHMRPRSQARSADRLIAVSHSTARDLQELYDIGPDRIAVIHSGVDADFHPVSETERLAFRRYHGLDNRFILSLCTQEPRKNLIGLVKAFERMAAKGEHTDVELVLAGPRGWLRHDIRRVLKCSPVRNRIRMIGPVEGSARVLWYNTAALLAYPSFFEGFGFPPLEAMACGTPVIASHHSSLPEVVGDAGILIDPYDIAALASAMSQVLGDKELSRRLADKGIIRSSRFSWRTAAERTLDALVPHLSSSDSVASR
jgi:glycosyltransferase involved in cell wall biosynthesis